MSITEAIITDTGIIMVVGTAGIIGAVDNVLSGGCGVVLAASSMPPFFVYASLQALATNTMEPIIIHLIVWAFIVVGVIGTVAPVLPGTGLIFAGIALYAWYFGVETIGWGTLIALGVVAVITFFFDYLASAYGAAKFGSTKYGVIGSVIGGVLGMITLNIPGLLIGMFSGAVIGEMAFSGRSQEQAFKAGWGTLLGFLGGTIMKLLFALAMVLIFVFKVVF